MHPHYLCAQESGADREKEKGVFVCVGGCTDLRSDATSQTNNQWAWLVIILPYMSQPQIIW